MPSCRTAALATVCTSPSDNCVLTVFPSSFLNTCLVPSDAYTAEGSSRAPHIASSALFSCCTSRFTCVPFLFITAPLAARLISTSSPKTMRARHCSCNVGSSKLSSCSCTGTPCGHSGHPVSSKKTVELATRARSFHPDRKPSSPTSALRSQPRSPPVAT